MSIEKLAEFQNQAMNLLLVSSDTMKLMKIRNRERVEEE